MSDQNEVEVWLYVLEKRRNVLGFAKNEIIVYVFPYVKRESVVSGRSVVSLLSTGTGS